MNTVNNLFIEDGTYTQLTSVAMRSNVTVWGHKGKVTINLPGGYVSLRNGEPGTPLQNVVIDGINFNVKATQSYNGSWGPIMCEAPSMENFTVRNCQGIRSSNSAAYCNFIFIKIQAGKTARGIKIENNYASGFRMGFEIINHDQFGVYAGSDISVVDNTFDNCQFGVSFSGPLDGIKTDNNYFINCSLYGIEIAGAIRNCSITKNRFRGNFERLIAGNNDGAGMNGGSVTDGMHIASNTTIGTCKGSIYLANGGKALFENNIFRMTGRLELVHSTNGGLYTSNYIESQDPVAVINDNVSNNRFIGNYFANVNTNNQNWSVCRSYGSKAKNNTWINNVIHKVPSAGFYIDTDSGGSNKIYDNYDGNGNPLKTGGASARISGESAGREAIFSGNGVLTQFEIPHGQGRKPEVFTVDPTSPDAADNLYLTADETNIIVHYTTAPPSGSNNVRLVWTAR
ncbi:hypothetical protein [Larkinella soli]|uniref:hypothetical protein n=1 Tax=Larkinella soli TaxID=1770527 RepID=UPI000FFC1178|nr:hypothetical protein [Larkinella soli]